MKKKENLPDNPERRRLITKGTTSAIGLGLATAIGSDLAAQDCSIGCPTPPSSGSATGMDTYLTGNPQITHFKTEYERHTEFARETISISMNGSVATGGSSQVTITRNGDLASNMVLKVTLERIEDIHGDPVTWVDNVGHVLLEEVELRIGGSTIDKHTGDWLEIFRELTVDESKQAGYQSMLGTGAQGETVLYIPLQFFFNRNPGLALPLIALQFHEVTLHFKFAELFKLIKSDGFYVGNGIKDVQLLVDYIFLDSEERRRFAQVGHEYLIEQVQYTEHEITSTNMIDLDFNHSVKALYVVIQADALSGDSGNPLAYSDALESMRLDINGHERAERMPGQYFRTVTACQSHTRIPSKPIHIFPFALYPERHQPSGTTNFSRIDNPKLALWIEPSKEIEDLFWSAPVRAKIFATNYNVLRIMSGMGGLAYSN